MPKKIAVIDGNSLMHRAYHAVPQTMNAPDGTPTNAVFGFLAMLLKFIDMASPDAIICADDAWRPTPKRERSDRFDWAMDTSSLPRSASVSSSARSKSLPISSTRLHERTSRSSFKDTIRSASRATRFSVEPPNMQAAFS